MMINVLGFADVLQISVTHIPEQVKGLTVGMVIQNMELKTRRVHFADCTVNFTKLR